MSKASAQALPKKYVEITEQEKTLENSHADAANWKNETNGAT